MNEPTALRSLGPQTLPPRLATVLRRVQLAERAAVGEQRRPTFKLMRDLLGASIRLGLSTQALANHLGTRRDSVRNRASRDDGTLSEELIVELTGLTLTELNDLLDGQLTPDHCAGAISTTAFVRALLSLEHPARFDGDAS